MEVYLAGKTSRELFLDNQDNVPHLPDTMDLSKSLKPIATAIDLRVRRMVP